MKTLSLLSAFALGLAFCSPAQAVVPAPDGGYPGGNTAEGQSALLSLTTGIYNTAVGVYSLLSNTDDNFNTALGAGTLLFNTADENTATGAGALLTNTTGFHNTATGAFALFNNTEGQYNTAIGTRALLSNTTGSFNTANGGGALSSNTEGGGNTANGYSTLVSNTTGSNNTATGVGALNSNTTADFNTANGDSALFHNTEGDQNTAIGTLALYSNTTGLGNVALGNGAGFNATTGNLNVYIGAGMVGVAGESNACYIASIFGQTSVNGVPVLINSDNKLGTATSSKRFKKDIQSMDKASEALLALKPVTFRYKKEIDPAGKSQFGLVAEEVDKVNPDLVVHDKDGKPYTVRYEAVNAMLLNEFLKEHKKVEEQEATIARLTKAIEAVVAHAKEQDSKIQKVSAQLELNKPVTQFAGVSH